MITKKVSEIQAKRDALRIGVEQTVYFADKILPEIEKFYKQKNFKQLYPILTKAVVTENWPELTCKSDNFSGLVHEVCTVSNGRPITILNSLEGFSMFFICGIAESKVAYNPVCVSFCDFVRIFLPYIIIVNKHTSQFTNVLHLYGMWRTMKNVEYAQQEISKHKDTLSKIKVPDLKPFGSDSNC